MKVDGAGITLNETDSQHEEMRIPGLTEDVIASHAGPSSVERGRSYFDDGAVKSLRRRSDTDVEVFVQGSDIAPYRVDIRHDAGGVTAAECTCPYVTGSWCRHIVAALYAIVDSEGALSRPTSEMLELFDRAELVRLVEHIVANHPGAAVVLEEAYRDKQSD